MSRTPVLVKICGVTDEEAVAAAIGGGADMVGFVFFPKSPRAVTPERCAELIDGWPEEDAPKIVGLFVDPTDAELDAVFRCVRLDVVQLHGSETPERVEAIRLEYGVEAIKAIGVAEPEDLKAAEPYHLVADYLLFDAKPPKDADRPGGNAVSFPWAIMKGWTKPGTWLLAGGLTPANVRTAIDQSGAPGVDVSSGVENSPGEKDPDAILAFIEAVDG